MPDTSIVLGIESSCDDTAAAILRLDDGAPYILASVVLDQTDLHSDFGGVVPEIAARAHTEKLDIAVEKALGDSGIAASEIDLVAVTSGPGLIGGVLSGVCLAKGLCAGLGVPLIGVNHLAGHALTPRLTDNIAFPYLMLLVSGGHCQFLVVEAADRFRRLGGTIDDAPGEAFDKVARLLGLPQPGGPSVEHASQSGDPDRFDLPKPLLRRPDADMSFSGLKTAVLRTRDALPKSEASYAPADIADLCAGFQSAVASVLAAKSRRALEIASTDYEITGFCVAGGVAANQRIRRDLETIAAEFGVPFTAPRLDLCTDNAAMIAWAGYEKFCTSGTSDTELVARPRWPLDQSQAPMLGSGKRGAKA